MSKDSELRLSPLLPTIAETMSELLDRIAGEHTLFALFIFSDGQPGSHGQYIANCKREQAAAALRELLDKWETTGGDDGPLHATGKTH